jgi:CrcB protein
MNLAFAIAAGGGLGALARHYLSGAIGSSGGFPWGILTVNVLGGFVMGVILDLGALKYSFSPELRAFLVTGILGGFTTFSAFSLDTMLLIERGAWGLALAYVLASVVLSVGALSLGLVLVRASL